MARKGFVIAGAMAAMMMSAAPASATFGLFGGGLFGGGLFGHGGGLFCSGGNGGCTNSPVTYRSCVRETARDLAALKCDVVSFFIDLIRGRPTADNLADIAADAAELHYDFAVLKTLARR